MYWRYRSVSNRERDGIPNENVYVEMIGTKLNDLDIRFRGRLKKVMSTIASHSPLNILAPLELKATWAWPKSPPIWNGLWGIEWSHDRWRHVTPKGQTPDPKTLRVQYFENSWRCYLVAFVLITIVCCGAVRSAILATAWLLVKLRLLSAKTLFCLYWYLAIIKLTFCNSFTLYA